MPSKTKDWLKGTSVWDYAYFLVQHALTINYLFQETLQSRVQLKNMKITGNLKINLFKIGEKIMKSKIEGEELNPYRVDDMIRGTIECSTPQDLKTAFDCINSLRTIEIVRVIN